jgi:hypothetical protein
MPEHLKHLHLFSDFIVARDVPDITNVQIVFYRSLSSLDFGSVLPRSLTVNDLIFRLIQV